MRKIYQAATAATLDSFKKIQAGDEFIGLCEGTLCKEIAASAAFYNFDADVPDWEVEAESGCYWCWDSVYIPVMDHGGKKIFCLEKTVERDSLRDFQIIFVTSDLERAKKELMRNVVIDSFGDFANNGFEVMTETECRSKYNEGFTAYEITEHKLII